MQSSEDRYREFIEDLINDRKIETSQELENALKEERERLGMNFGMGQKVNPQSLRIGLVRDWDSKWYPEKNGGELFISSEMIHYSLENRKIHLVQLLGKKKYKKIVNQVKTLSR